MVTFGFADDANQARQFCLGGTHPGGLNAVGGSALLQFSILGLPQGPLEAEQGREGDEEGEEGEDDQGDAVPSRTCLQPDQAVAVATCCRG